MAVEVTHIADVRHCIEPDLSLEDQVVLVDPFQFLLGRVAFRDWRNDRPRAGRLRQPRDRVVIHYRSVSDRRGVLLRPDNVVQVGTALEDAGGTSNHKRLSAGQGVGKTKTRLHSQRLVAQSTCRIGIQNSIRIVTRTEHQVPGKIGNGRLARYRIDRLLIGRRTGRPCHLARRIVKAWRAGQAVVGGDESRGEMRVIPAGGIMQEAYSVFQREARSCFPTVLDIKLVRSQMPTLYAAYVGLRVGLENSEQRVGIAVAGVERVGRSAAKIKRPKPGAAGLVEVKAVFKIVTELDRVLSNEFRKILALRPLVIARDIRNVAVRS